MLIAGFFSWGLANARAEPVVRTATIGLTDWPADAPPIRVALVSDIHLGNVAMDRRRLDRIVAQINALHPDLILLAGDFVVGHSPSGAEARAAGLAAPLAKLRARHGVAAVLGNHDHWTGSDGVRAALSRAGVVVLENQALRAGPIALAGVGDAFSGHADPELTLRAARPLSLPIVVLTHSPDISDALPADAALVLAGHTHCGQVMLPWGAPLITRSPREKARRLYDPRYRCGPVHALGRDVFVTAGVGSGTLPVRFGAPPDVWLLTLGPDLKRGAHSETGAVSTP